MQQTWALCDKDGVVAQMIVADQAFIDALPGYLADPDVDSGDLVAAAAHDVTDVAPRPSEGWRLRGGKWTAPLTLEPAMSKVGPDGSVRLTFTDHRPEPEASQLVYLAGELRPEPLAVSGGSAKLTVRAADLPARPGDLPADADWHQVVTVGSAQAIVALSP